MEMGFRECYCTEHKIKTLFINIMFIFSKEKKHFTYPSIADPIRNRFIISLLEPTNTSFLYILLLF